MVSQWNQTGYFVVRTFCSLVCIDMSLPCRVNHWKSSVRMRILLLSISHLPFQWVFLEIGFSIWIPGGGVLTLTWYMYMCLLFGLLFDKIWYSDRWVFIRNEEPKLYKLGVFWANYGKSTLSFENGILMSGLYCYCTRNWYRESYNFPGATGTSTYNFGESTPLWDLNTTDTHKPKKIVCLPSMICPPPQKKNTALSNTLVYATTPAKEKKGSTYQTSKYLATEGKQTFFSLGWKLRRIYLTGIFVSGWKHSTGEYWFQTN